MLRFIFALFVGFSLGSAVEAAPRDGRVVEGSGSISQSGTHTDIRQNSDFLATHWGSFNIAAHESVQAHQPGASSRLLIRVDGGGATNIAGTFTANGITILENRNGVQFSRGAIVNVGGLLATSSRISGVAGAHWQLNGTGGAVVNHGQIVAGAGGAILAAVKVQNTGDITAKGGDVALGAGSSFTVDFAGSMVGFEITQAASGASITTTGKIEAQGGVVSLSAQEAQAVRTNVVSVGGVVKATRLERRGGVVYLSGGDAGIAEVSGDVSASRKVQTTGEYIVVKGGALLKAPKILVGGDFQGKGDVPTSRRTLVEAGALLDAGANGRVPKGRVIVWSDETTWFNGDISAPGGFAEVSGKETLASVNLAGIDVGDLLLDPADIIIVRFGAIALLEDSPNGDIAADDTPSGTLTLGTRDINAYEGDLSLAASNTIMVMVNSAIDKPTGGLTLDAGGVLTISADITMSAGNLTLTGSAVSLTGNLRNIGNNITITADTGDITITGDITATGAGDIALTGANIVLGSALTSLTGDEVSLTGAINESTDNDSLAIDVRGRLTLNSGINLGTGTLAINARERINLVNASTVITAGTFTIKFTNIDGVGDAAAGFTIGSTATLGNLAATSTMPTYTFAAGNPVDCVINTGACILTTTGNANLATADAALASDVSITIDIGIGALTFGGSAMLITITAPEVTITAATIDLGGRSLTITSNGATLALNLNADISNADTLIIGAVDKTLTLKSTEAELTLAATDISLLSNNNIRFAQSLDLAASGLLTLNSGLNARGLTLGATTGAGRRIRLIPSASGFLTISITSGTLTINSEITNIVDGQPNEIFPTSVSFQTGRGTLVLNADINIAAYTGSGDSIHNFSLGSSFSVSRLLILGGNRTVKTFGNLNYAFNGLDESAILNTETGQGGNDNFTLQAGGTLTFRGDSTNASTDVIDINLGTGELILTGTDVRNPDDGTLMTQGISLNILNFRLTGKAVTFNGTVATVDRGRATDIQTFAITARGGNITLNGGINLFSFMNDQLDGSITLDSDTAIVLGRDVTLAADRVFLTGAIDERATPRALTIMTRTSITLNSDIDLGSGNLTLTSGSTLVLADGVTLAGGAVSLTGEIFLGFANHSITITAMGVLTLNDNIDVGDGALTLTGTNGIVLGGDITLIGGAISLTGAIDESTVRVDGDGKGGRDSLTITASNVLTLGSSINLGTTATATGTGTLTITAERISAARITLTAARPISITFTGENIISPAQGFTVDNVPTLGMVTFVPSVAYMPLPTLSCTGIDDCMLGDGMTALTLPAMLTAPNILTINAGSLADITFDGVGPIVISAQTITITAKRLFIEDGRPLTITAAAGALTVNANIRSDMVPSAITLTASSGVLTLGGGISGTSRTPTGNITLTGVDVRGSGDVLTMAGIVLGETVILNGAIISLSGSIAEPDASTDALTIMASGIITLNNDIALGMGNLTLNSTNGITLGSALTLTGAAINLTRAITGTNDFTVNASGTLTLNGNINIGAMAALSLTAGAGAINGTLGGNADMLTAGTVSLTQVMEFAELAPFTFGSATLLTLATAASQMVHGWMTSGSRALSLTSTGGMITINADIATGTSNLTLNGNMGIVLPTSNNNLITLTGGAVELTGAVNGNSSDDALDNSFTITASGGITINDNINLGTGRLILTATGANIVDAAGTQTLTASTVSLTQSGAFGSTALFTFATPTLNLTTAASQTVHGWMFAVSGRNLSLRSTTGGMITINADIATGSGNLTLNGNMGIVLAVGNMRRLSGAAVSLTGAITSGSHNLTVTATGQLTLNSNIALTGSGAVLTLTAGTNIASDVPTDETLTASTVSLMQASAFAPGALFTFATGTLNLETAAPQMVHDWMIPNGRNLSLTSTGGAITIGRDIALGAGNLALNGGTLVFSGAARTLSGANITLTGDADSAVALSLTATGTLTLNDNVATTGATSDLAIMGTGGITTAAGIALTSGSDLTTSGVITAADGNGSLTLNAAGTITLGGNINLGTGTATLNAGSATGLDGSSVITAAVITISFSNMAITRRADVSAIDPDGSPTITFVGDLRPIRYGARECENAVDCVIMGDGNLFVQHELEASASITIETTGAGSSVRFDGESTDTIMLTAPLVTITADTINLEGRDLVIVGAGGARLTLAGNVSGAAAITARNAASTTFGSIDIVGARTIAGGGAITLTAAMIRTVNRVGTTNTLAAHNLTITATDGLTVGAINIGTGALTLTAGDGGTGDISNDGTERALTAGTVSLTQDGTFVPTAMFDFASATSLTLEATAPATNQIVHGWMVADDRTLSLTTTGEITVNANIAIGMGSLTLSGASIVLGSNLDSLAGNAISLTGAIVRTGNVALTITAMGDITLNSDINTDTGTLTLSGTSIFLRGGARTLAGSAVTLTGILDSRVSEAGAAANNITITAGTGDITINGDIFASGNGGDLLSGNGGNLNLTATSGNIMITGDITATGGNGMFDDSTGDGSEDGGNGGSLILTATGNITIDGNINLDAERGEGNNDGSRGNGGNGGNGGGLTLTTTGGNITVGGSVNANGGNGGVVANLDNGGGGGAGGIIILEGDSVMVGLINARSGSGGTHTGEGSLGADGANGSVAITATGGNLTLNGNIDVDGGAITLIAGGTGATIGNGGTQRTLTAGTVSLTQAGTFADNLFTIASAASLTLDAGSAAQTVHAWMAGGTNRALSLTTTGAITIGRDIATGTSSLTLDGGTLTLTAPAILSGADIALTGALTSAGLALTITALGDITINDDIDLGAGALTLTAGMGGIGDITGNGDITEDGRPTLTATTVSLMQDDIFGNQLFTFAGISLLNLSQDATASQNYQPWMRVGAGTSLSLTATGGGAISLPAALNFGSDNLTLSSGVFLLASGLTHMISGGMVSLTGAISDADASLTLTITAMDALTLNDNISLTGSGAALILIAGTSGAGNILSDMATDETLTAGTVSLTQAGAFAPDALFMFASTVGALNLTTGEAQTVYDWMVANDRGLSLTTTDAITIGIDIATASRDLTLDGGALAFSGTARILSGANISLTGAATHADDLTITATGTLTIASNITINGGDLMLTGGTGGIVIGTATGSPALTWSGGVIALMGDVTTASTAGIDNFANLTITAQNALTVAGIDLSNSDNSAYGNLLLIAGAGTQSGSTITFGGTLNAARVELRQDTDFDPARRPVDILIEGNDPGLEDNPLTVVISGEVEVPWARVLIVPGPLTITDGATNDPDGAPNNGIELDTARLVHAGDITLNAGAFDITFTTGVGPTITWRAPNITITARSVMLGDRTLTITAGEGGTLTLNVTSIIATGANNLAFAGTTINLGRASVGDVDPGTTTLTGSAITLTAANGITVGRFNQRGAFRPATAPALAVDASGVLTIAADITSVANITLGSTDSITVTSARTITGRAITLTGDVTATDGLTVNAAGNLVLDGDIGTGTSALSLMSAAAIRILGEANATRTLTGGDITLTAANGVEATASQSNLTVTASGMLTIAAGITTTEGTLTLQGAGAIGNGGADRPRLTASTVSLAQIDAFAADERGRGLFRFTAGSLVLATEAAQDVHNWMIALDRNLTLTSPARVRVTIAIGAGVPGRNIGTGSLTLTSTRANIRIQQNISTTGNISLSGVTGGINFNNGAAKTLSGAAITLTGVVVSNRDLTITASGILRLNNNITATAGNLVLTGGGEIDLVSALTLSGGDIMLTGAIAENANGLTITADGTLTINSNINTGSGDLTLMSGTIQITRGPDDAAGTVRTLTGANITLTAANGIEIGRLNRGGAFFVNNSAANFTVTASGVLTIAADITVDSTATSGGDIMLTGGGIVIGTAATGSSALTWSGSNITLTGAVTTASAAGIDNFTDLTLSARGDLTVGEINLGNDASGSADAWGDLILQAGTGTITVTGGSSAIIDAGSILFRQDGEIFAGTAGDEPANLHINGVDVSGTPSLRSMVLVLSTDVQASVDWGTVIRAGAIVMDTGVDLLIALFNDALTSLVSITINAGTGTVTFDAAAVDITLAAPVITITAGSIDAENRNLTIMTDGGTLTLNSDIATGTGDLTLTSGTIRIARSGADTLIDLSGQDITLTAAGGITVGRLNGSGIFFVNNSAANFTVTASGVLAIAADITVDSTATSGGNITLMGGGMITFTGARTLSGVDITLMGDATGTADLTITANGTLTLNDDINTGAGALTLSGAGAIVGVGTPELTASTVSLTQVDAFAEIALFMFGSNTGSLELTTTVNQEVYNWMILENTDLTVESPGSVRVEAAIGAGETGRNLGTGDLTLTSTGGLVRILANITTGGAITLSGGGTDGINLNSTATSTGTVTLTGAAITLTGNVVSNRALAINASGTLRLNNSITLTGAGALSLSGDTLVRIAAAITTDGDITLSGGTDGINLTGADTLTGAAIMLTGDARSNRALTLTASGTLTLNGGINTGTSALSLSGSSVALGGALTLMGGDITLTGDATGTASLTITASGTLTLNNDINIGTNALTLTSGVGAIVGTGRPRLTAGMVSLAQVDAFPVTRTIRFIPGSSLAITAEAPQDVHDWMILEDIDLTVTSSNRVRVVAIIGTGGVAGRNLGDGSITLTSTGGTVRILADITTDGNITLSGVTGGINLNSGAGAKELSGAIITLTGDARSDRDLALTASGALTLNGGINTGTSALSLSGSGGITLGSALTLTGGAIELTGDAAGAANLTITASGTLTINNSITLTGADLTLALSGAGAIVGMNTPALTASTVSLAQVDAFAAIALFTFGGTTDSLELTTTVNQDVYNWMILENTDLTVTSAANVIVRSAIGAGETDRNLGTGNITLESTGAVVRIFAGISTTGNLTLNGNTGINLSGGAAKTLAGAIITLTGAARSNQDLALTASGILTIDSDINIGTNALTLTSGAGAIVATGRPRLTAGMVSFSQVDALPATRPFRFIPGSSLAITTEAAQDVHDWMIRENIDLTVTSSNRVRVVAIIGTGGVAGRNLGTGALSLTSTGGAVRILANISISNNITLSGGTGGINLNGTDTLSGAIITLTGDARGNRDLTITASGVLTINNNINIGTGALSLTGPSLTFGPDVDLAAGSHSLTPSLTCDTGTMPSCTVNTP